MLKVFFGNDTVAVREAAFAVADKELSSDKTLETIDSDNHQTGIYADAAGGVSLFGGGQVYVVDTPSTSKEFYEDTLDNLSLLAESPHTFIVIEEVLLAAEKKKWQKHADAIEEFKAGSAERFNVFAIAEALSRKDKKSLWLILNEARLAEIPFEELVGILWWQLKTLRLAESTGSATEAGIKDFPYNKAKRSLTKFSRGEIGKLSESLQTLLHDSRLGLCELDVALERWVLRI